MSASLEVWLIAAGALILASVLASKVSGRAGLPSLVLFLLVGMLAGSEGLGGIEFDDPVLAQYIGVVALAFILFAGGLDTEWRSVRPVLAAGLGLSTFAVIATAVVMGAAVVILLDLPWLQGLLLGALVSSTDAAAVFSVMRSRGIGWRDRVRRVLELESGSNDPMAAFLTIGIIGLLVGPGSSWLDLVPLFVQQMLVGALVGVGVGRVAVAVINRLDLAYDGLYPVFTFALVALVYGVATVLGGNGFLAVYRAGVSMARHHFIHKRSITRFHDGVAWLMQIAMFVILGLLVFPSRLPAISLAGLGLAFVLVFVARPVGVFATLWWTRLRRSEIALISWVGLRGAVPIILATYPLVWNVPNAALMFDVVFFVVLISVLVQGPTIPWVARLLHVDEPETPKTRYPIEFEQTANLDSDLTELIVPKHSPASGRKILELGLPENALVVLLGRDGQFLVPRGATVLQEGDRLLLLTDALGLAEVERLLKPG